MVRHRVHRLVVCDGATRCSACSPSSTWSASSPAIRTSSRCRSTRPRASPTLGRAAARIDAMIALLHDGGIKIERIARPRQRAERAPVRAAVVAARAARARRQQLPGRDGQRRPRRADPEDRPGQRAAAARRLRAGRPRRGGRALQRRARSSFGYPPCPGDIMLSQPAVAPAAGGVSRDDARLAATAPTRRARCASRSSSTPRPSPATPSLLDDGARPPRQHLRRQRRLPRPLRRARSTSSAPAAAGGRG